ncbi:MAG: hypothetical protein LUE87_09795 [Lachnospiraceae bacterium]|nr:hypothetical protein [Lachnospiraceae bacterium]
MLCHCDACNYTFEASVLHSKYDVPRKCPACRKKTVGNRVPAVRAATNIEIADYWKIQKEIMEELSNQLIPDDDTVENDNGQEITSIRLGAAFKKKDNKIRIPGLNSETDS